MEPDAVEKKAVKSYSQMAVSCFCITLATIALLLVGMLLAGDAKTLAVRNIVLCFIGAIVFICAAYLIYRLIDRKKN